MKITIEYDDREQEVIENFNNIIVIVGDNEETNDILECDGSFIYEAVNALEYYLDSAIERLRLNDATSLNNLIFHEGTEILNQQH